jgi:dienelactone hydrolase
MTRHALLFGLIITIPAPLRAQEKSDLSALLGREVVGSKQSLAEMQVYLEGRIPRMPAFKTAAEWGKYAADLRSAVLERVVFRGEAAKWRDAKCKVEWQDTIDGGPGYRIKKVRYEALPGLWIPALLYEPEKLTGKVPVILNVNGHDGAGKAAEYKQLRCINLAKRGMLALNLEWVGMGQLRTPGFNHGSMNQLDLCGSSGLAPYYLSMSRGLDLLLALPNADPQRVAVTGLSGGGWQTIWISALDTRVTLSNPVAGYSSFLTRIRHFKDLGDSEQTPTDMATLADYAHLTALLAPRAALLTYCLQDNCCFEAGYALPPLLVAASPVYRLLGRSEALASHINHDPGTHNYHKDNRQAFYRMVRDHFYAGDLNFDARDIPSEKEVKKPDELSVELPTDNADFNKLALALNKDLPREPDLPADKEAAANWQKAGREKLREVIKAKDFKVDASKAGGDEKGGIRATYWRLKLSDTWSIPVVELVRGEPKATAVLLNDAGRGVDAVNAERLLASGHRVLAVDPYGFGELKIERYGWLFDLLLASTGDRPLGLEASQMAAVARWSQAEHKNGPVRLVAVGPRTGIIALVAAGLEDKAIGAVELHGTLGSLKEIIEQNRTVSQMPEVFCFGLLEAFDIKQLAALAAPAKVSIVGASERAKKELGGLKQWYAVIGVEHEALK